MKRFKNILFLADRDDGLSASLDRAVDLSQTNGARLTVMDVMPDAAVADYIKRSLFRRSECAAQTNSACSSWKRSHSRIQTAAFPFTPR